MEKVFLAVELRSVVGKKVKRLRQKGLVPATVYGKSFAPVTIQVNERNFNTIYRQVGRTSLVELDLPDKPVAFIQAVQRHPISRLIIHADFRVVDLKVAITTEVPIVLTGKSPLAERGIATLSHALTTVVVEALPAELPQHIEIDLSVLDSLEKSIHVRDLPKGAGYEILTAGDELVVWLAPVTVKVEAEAEVKTAEPEVVRKKREEETKDKEKE